MAQTELLDPQVGKPGLIIAALDTADATPTEIVSHTLRLKTTPCVLLFDVLVLAARPAGDIDANCVAKRLLTAYRWDGGSLLANLGANALLALVVGGDFTVTLSEVESPPGTYTLATSIVVTASDATARRWSARCEVSVLPVP